MLQEENSSLSLDKAGTFYLKTHPFLSCSHRSNFISWLQKNFLWINYWSQNSLLWKYNCFRSLPHYRMESLLLALCHSCRVGWKCLKCNRCLKLGIGSCYFMKRGFDWLGVVNDWMRMWRYSERRGLFFQCFLSNSEVWIMVTFILRFTSSVIALQFS